MCPTGAYMYCFLQVRAFLTVLNQESPRAWWLIALVAVDRLSIDIVGEFSNWSIWDINYTQAQTRCQFINYSDVLEPRLSTALTGENHQGLKLVRLNRTFPLVLFRNYKGRHRLTLSNQDYFGALISTQL